MIKPQKSPKFPEIPWNFPEKSPRNLKNLPPDIFGLE